jgi:hypothetical protein
MIRRESNAYLVENDAADPRQAPSDESFFADRKARNTRRWDRVATAEAVHRDPYDSRPDYFTITAQQREQLQSEYKRARAHASAEAGKHFDVIDPQPEQVRYSRLPTIEAWGPGGMREFTLIEWRALSSAAEATPMSVVCSGGRTYWYFQGEFYSGTDELEAPDVAALIEARRIKMRRAVSRSYAIVQAQTDSAPTRHRIPDEVKSVVWVRDQGACVYCGAVQDLQYDHVIPLVMGGADSAKNLQLLCASCNREKGGNLV